MSWYSQTQELVRWFASGIVMIIAQQKYFYLNSF